MYYAVIVMRNYREWYSGSSKVELKIGPFTRNPTVSPKALHSATQKAESQSKNLEPSQVASEVSGLKDEGVLKARGEQSAGLGLRV